MRLVSFALRTAPQKVHAGVELPASQQVVDLTAALSASHPGLTIRRLLELGKEGIVLFGRSLAHHTLVLIEWLELSLELKMIGLLVVVRDECGQQGGRWRQASPQVL